MPAAIIRRIKKFQSVKGFTLIELMVVIGIIGILTALGISSYQSAQTRSRDAKRKTDIKQIQAALELYKADYGHYPCSGGVGWLYSTDAAVPWIHNTPADGYCSYYGETESSDFTAYMKQIPMDPVNNSSYRYWYYSYGGPWYNCAAGQYYFLVATLENASDPMVASKTNPTLCGQPIGTGWGANTYINQNP